MGRRIAVEMLVVAAVGLALAALGPFGTYAAPFGPRAVYWMGLMLAGYAIVRPMIGVSGWLSAQTGLNRLPSHLLAVAVAAVPLSLLVSFTAAQQGSGSRTDFVQLYLQVLGIGVVMTLFMSRFLPAEPVSRPSTPTPPPEPARPRFLDRLPPEFEQPLLCLSMEDHYVRAHGPGGSALVLMRMRDAVAELEGLPGLQVHRSWWVASSTVERVDKEGGRLRLRLVNGMVVPVARSQLGTVRAQRWPGA